MELREINDKKEWEDFFLDIEDKTFLQSFAWGKFQKNLGNKIWRFGIYEDNLIGVFLMTKIVAKRGTFLLIQHGPVIKNKKDKELEEILKKIFSELKKIALREKVSFIRFNPLWERNEKNNKILKKLGTVFSPIQENAYESTLKLNLDISEEELLKNMRKTTRYLIKKTSKDQNIIIEKSNNPILLLKYQELNKKVGKRQGFIPFSYNFIKNEFETFLKDDNALLFLGRYDDKIVCGALIIFWNNIGFYHQAASNQEFARFSIPYLLQWEAIKEAKKRGCLFYDFWGYIDPKKFPKHPWAGPTLFKLGYGGSSYTYVKSRDFVVSKKYWITYLFETIRKLKRKI